MVLGREDRVRLRLLLSFKISTNIAGGKAIAIYIDFSKAFDSVNQYKLIQKLMFNFSYRIPPYIIRTLIYYFTNRKFSISNGDYKSKYFSIKSGVPPGSQLGPLTYSLYINDIGSVIDLPYKFYADDAVIYCDCDSFDEGKRKIQDCVDKVNDWCLENGLKINASKTKYMVFYKAKDVASKTSAMQPMTITLNGESIERVLDFKYLGVNVDSNLNFKTHYESVDKKTCVALARL